MLRPALFIAALLAATAAVAAGPRDTMLVTSDWLAQHLNDANLVILHAGAQGDYTAGHIPGARLAPQDALSASAAASGGLTLELPTSGDLQFKMTEFGISDNSRIVVYANRQTETATRLVLALDSAGFGDKTVLLDGGLADWRRTNHATSTEVPAAKQGRVSGFTLRPTTVDVNTLRSRMGRPGTVVIDARAPVFYDGVQAGMATTKRGHIPGAKNIPNCGPCSPPRASSRATRSSPIATWASRRRRWCSPPALWASRRSFTTARSRTGPRATIRLKARRPPPPDEA